MALSFNVKEINYKKFFLEKGEWIGVGVALLIALPVLGNGISMALFSGSASKNAADVKNLADGLDNRIRTSPVPADAGKPPPESNLKVDMTLVDSAKFLTPEPWFIQSQLEDTKRRKPEILNPSDFMASVVRFGTLGYKTRLLNGKWYVLVRTERDPIQSPAQKRLQKRLEKIQKALGNRMGASAMMPGAGGGMQGRMGMGTTQQMMSGKTGGGMGMGMMMGGPGGPRSGAASRSVREAKWEEVEKVNANPNTQLAEELYTGRMVLVEGAFPAKEQLELFRAALRKPSLADMVALIDTDEFRFVNLDIERREITAGKPPADSDWEKNYDKVMKQELTRLLAVALEVDPPDPELVEYAMIPRRGLCWPRPKLELPYGDPEQAKYPKATEIESIKESLEKLKKVAQETSVKPPSYLLERIKGDVDVLDPFGGQRTEQDSAAQEPAKPPAEGEKKEDANAEPEPVLPEKVLVRFIDLTVVPGHTYEYRVRVRAANPNYNKKNNLAYPSLARDKELAASDWAMVPPVKVPYDVNWYAVDKRLNSDQATLQIQRWLDAYVDPKNEKNELKVGDWTIWDNARFSRGEYIGRMNEAQFPAWSIDKDDFEIAHNPARPSSTKIPVDFTVRQGNARSPALLVDFAGGRLEEKIDSRPIKEDAPIGVLVLEPDGRLEMRSTADDLKDEERTARFDNWKKRLKEVQQGGGSRRQPGMNTLPGGDLFNKGGKN